MKKKIALLIGAVLIAGSLFSGCGSKKNLNTSTDSAQVIKEKGKFIVGLDDSFPPMGFRDEKGEIVGFDIDLAKEAAERMGVEVEFKPIDWDGVILSLYNKDIDVIWNGLTITEERKGKIGFTKAYLKNKQIIVTTSGSNIDKKSQLEGKIVGVQMGSSSDEALNKDKETAESLKEIKKYPNNTDALLDLKSGRIDAVVLDEIVGRYYTSKKEGEYKILKDNFGGEEYGVGYRKEDESFGQALDKILDEMKEDGTADEISKEWFGEAIVEK